MINISPNQFSANLAAIRVNFLSPSVQWTSIQIFLRTLWTNIKESNTTRNLARPVPACANCTLAPEHAVHLMYECSLAQGAWRAFLLAFNNNAVEQYPDHSDVTISRDLIMFNHPLTLHASNNAHPVPI